MSVGSWTNLKPLFWILLIVAAAAESGPSGYELYYACDDSGLHIAVTFDRPFKGLLYIKGYSADPSCRLSFPVPSLEASFDVPLMACGTFVRFPDANPWMKGFLVFQQHPLIPTVDDFTEPFVCVAYKNPSTSWSDLEDKASNVLSDSPKVDSWMDFELLPGVSSETKLNFDPSKSYLFLYVSGVRQFTDMVVTDCIAHKEPFLFRNTSFDQLTDCNGCTNNFTNALSPFKIIRKDDLIIGTYSEINPVQIKNLEKGFISCSAVLCKYRCECSKDNNPVGYEIVFTRKFPKRPNILITNITATSNMNNQTRKMYMIATVKTLAKRLRKNQRQLRFEINDADFEKKVSNTENGTITVMYSNDTSSSFIPTQNPPSTEFSTELYSNIENRKLDQKDVFSVGVSMTEITEIEVEKLLTNLVEFPTMAEPFQKHATSEDHFSDNHSTTFIPEFELEKKLEQSTTETISNNEATIENLEEPRQKREDLILTANGTAETEDLGYKIGNETIVAEESQLDPSYCVPKLRYVVVTTVLSCIVLILILVSCGLSLYLRKEKKKHAIDNFLLYNYF